MTPAEQAREELAKVSSLVLTARRLVAGGKLVDLAALGERVRAVCEVVESMPREDGRVLVGDMQTLMAKLDRLASDLEEHLDHVAVPPAGRREGGA